MHAPFGLWPRIIAFLAHTVGATAHPEVHYASKRTSTIITTLFIAIGVVDCLFGHTPYTLIFNTAACAIMIWVAVQDLFFVPKDAHHQSVGVQPDQERKLEEGWTTSSKKLEAELQKLAQTLSPNLSDSDRQQVGVCLQTIRGKIEENTKGCERIAGVIRQLRENNKKVDADYLGAYHEKLEECAKDANCAVQKAHVYLASFKGGQQEASWQQVNALADGRTGSVAGYLESHVGQLLQLAERISVPAEPKEGRLPNVVRIGKTPIIIQGLAQNSIFIQQLDENRAVISSQPFSPQMQPERVAYVA